MEHHNRTTEQQSQKRRQSSSQSRNEPDQTRMCSQRDDSQSSLPACSKAPAVENAVSFTLSTEPFAPLSWSPNRSISTPPPPPSPSPPPKTSQPSSSSGNPGTAPNPVTTTTTTTSTSFQSSSSSSSPTSVQSRSPSLLSSSSSSSSSSHSSYSSSSPSFFSSSANKPNQSTVSSLEARISYILDMLHYSLGSYARQGLYRALEHQLLMVGNHHHRHHDQQQQEKVFDRSTNLFFNHFEALQNELKHSLTISKGEKEEKEEEEEEEEEPDDGETRSAASFLAVFFLVMGGGAGDADEEDEEEDDEGEEEGEEGGDKGGDKNGGDGVDEEEGKGMQMAQQLFGYLYELLYEQLCDDRVDPRVRAQMAITFGFGFFISPNHQVDPHLPRVMAALLQIAFQEIIDLKTWKWPVDPADINRLLPGHFFLRATALNVLSLLGPLLDAQPGRPGQRRREEQPGLRRFLVHKLRPPLFRGLHHLLDARNRANRASGTLPYLLSAACCLANYTEQLIRESETETENGKTDDDEEEDDDDETDNDEDKMDETEVKKEKEEGEEMDQEDEDEYEEEEEEEMDEAEKEKRRANDRRADRKATLALRQMLDSGRSALRRQLEHLVAECSRPEQKFAFADERAIFRSVRRTVIDGRPFSVEKVVVDVNLDAAHQHPSCRSFKVFPEEVLTIDSWHRCALYQSFSRALKDGGMQRQLAVNPLLRRLFGLGPPMLLSRTPPRRRRRRRSSAAVETWSDKQQQQQQQEKVITEQWANEGNPQILSKVKNLDKEEHFEEDGNEEKDFGTVENQ